MPRAGQTDEAIAPLPHPGKPRYRMGAAALPGAHSVLFAGGGINPYNCDGIGYDDIPSEPSATTLAFDFDSDPWSQHPAPAEATMDQRVLACTSEHCYLVGGMRERQQVAASTVTVDLAPMRQEAADPPTQGN